MNKPKAPIPPVIIKNKPKRPKLLIEQLRFRGANLDFLRNHSHELILCAPSDTGKTFAACYKSIVLALSFPGCHAALVRKIYASIHESVGKTFNRVAAGLPCHKYGGENAGTWKFANGSVVVPVGMDRPDKLLSSEWDYIQVCQTEELKEADWETIASRCTGRGAVVKYPQIFGDCNPSGRLHWILQRSDAGKTTLLSGRHSDNPELYRDNGTQTEEGVQRIKKLEDTLTGVRRKRLLQGIWSTAEGAVYDTFDASVHVQTRAASEMQRWHLAVDEGYTNPAVVLLVGEDSDKRWHIAREFYQRGVLQSAHVAQVKQWWIDRQAETCAVDEAAAGLIADLMDAGVYARGGKGRVLDGIQRVQNRLKVQGDNRPRLTVDPGCSNTINEFESYVWAPDKPKDQPIKENDHAMDALRYLCDVLNEPTGAWDVSAPGTLASQSGTGDTDDGLELDLAYNTDLAT